MLENIFSSRVGTKIILEIGRKPYKEFYLYELSKSLKIGMGRSSTLLENFTKKNVLKSRKGGKTILYRLNKNNPLSSEIIRFAHLDSFLKMPERFRTSISRFTKRYEELQGENVVSIIIFGSVAKNKAKAWSDIDILVIVKKWPNEKTRKKLHDVFSEISEVFSQLSEEHMYTERQFSEGYDIGDDFLINVMKDGIIILDKGNFFIEHLIRGLPEVTKKAIEKRLDIAKEFIDNAIEIYKKMPDSTASMLGLISIHLSRAVLLLNDTQPGSKYEIPKQLGSVGESKFERVYKKTRKWFDESPFETDKEDVWKTLNFLKEKYNEYSRKIEAWS